MKTIVFQGFFYYYITVTIRRYVCLNKKKKNKTENKGKITNKKTFALHSFVIIVASEQLLFVLFS